jgi:arylsulfatase A-like enzyme
VHRRTVEALDAVGEGPFFLFVHYWDVHYDYAPPSPYDTMFDPDYEGAITSLNFYWNDEIHRGMAPRDLRHIVALYDGEIAYTDSYLGLLFDELRARGVWDDTLVVLTADHGDEFFEHGEKGHEKNLLGTTLDVPLIVKMPGGDRAGMRVDEFVSLVDIPATLLDVAGVTAATLNQGRSLREILTGAPAPRSLFASLGNGTAIIDEGHKLITVSQGDGDRVHHYLFDLLEDPGEHRNLAGTFVDRRASMADKQVEWSTLAAQARLVAEGVGEIDPAVLERLRSLGYIR